MSPRLLLLSLLTLTGGAVLAVYFYTTRGMPKTTAPVLTPVSVATHQSFYTEKISYDEAFDQRSTQTSQIVRAAITSHHFLAKDLIARTFLGIDSKDVRDVVIIGPDHYHALLDEAAGVTTDADWSTPYGTMSANKDKVKSLLQLPNIQRYEDLFESEHSIFTLVPFAKYRFPQAQIVPLVLKQSSSYQEYFDLGQKLATLVDPAHTVVIISSDFTHDASVQVAKEKDTVSIAQLFHPDLTHVSDVQSDCRTCVAFLYGYINRMKTTFLLNENKTSVDFGSSTPESVTSYVSAYYSASSSAELDSSVSILFGGDMMFDRSIRQVAERKGQAFLFGNLADFFARQDLVVTNLEGPITASQSASVDSVIGSRENYLFTFPTSTAKLLHDTHIDMVNIGNNHIRDFGRTGIDQTKQDLQEFGIAYFGNTGTSENDRFIVREIQGVRIAFVNYNAFVADSVRATLFDIESARKVSDIVVVYTHWGTEYTPIASDSIVSLAHRFIDAGADVIIGSHPHVIQQKEEYKGKWIYYSLGNLIFDQYFQPETQTGLVVRMQIEPASKRLSFEDVKVQLLPTGQTTLTP